MEHDRQLEVVVEIERRVMYLNYNCVILVVALDDAELTGRDGLPIPAPAEFSVVLYCNMALYVDELGLEVLEARGSFEVPVEVIGVERFP